ncbi:DedA family protein [Lysinibacter cavernae]|uniref:Membrane protein DedA with SNARE-associated domain n=1 Tax=Lysinibacter cavernae TaxID=1640652 RepID=A0A7X5QZX6_9MICO|nr:membrane protein DedA with SNARE-associated domain [Lysinibacter cavernae]
MNEIFDSIGNLFNGSGSVTDILDSILLSIQSVGPVWRAIIAGIAMMLETSVLIGLIVPGDTIAIVSSLGSQSVGESAILFAALVLGALTGESLGFALGRFLGPRIRHSWLGRRIGEPTWVRAERYLERRGGIAVFASRFLPVLHSVVPLTVGMSTMTYRRFLAWTAPACVVWAAAYVTVGYTAAASYEQLSQSLHWAGYVFVGIIVLFIVGVYVTKRIVHAAEQKHMHTEE